MSINYDKIFEEDPNKKSFYNAPGYPRPMLVDGTISASNARKRLDMGEYYTLVTFVEDDSLPMGYREITVSDINADVRFATISQDVRVQALCRDGGIQMVSNLARKGEEPNYLLGPGPETVSLVDMVNANLNDYDNMKSKGSSKK